MKKIIYIIILTLALTHNAFSAGSSGDGDSSDKISNYTKAHNLIKSAKKYDSSDMDTPLLKLKLVTAKFYPCKSYSIYITELIEDNKLIVELIGISKGELCLTAIGPAKSSDIKLPRNIGKYHMQKIQQPLIPLKYYPIYTIVDN